MNWEVKHLATAELDTLMNTRMTKQRKKLRERRYSLVRENGDLP